VTQYSGQIILHNCFQSFYARLQTSQTDLADSGSLLREMAAVGLIGNVVGRINEVNQRRARLLFGWVTVGRWVNHLGM